MTTAIPKYEPDASNNFLPDYPIPDRLEHPTNEGSTSDEDDSGLTASDKKTPDVPIKLVPFLDPLKGSFKMLQQWEGRVVETGGSEFTAIIADKTNPDVENQFVTVNTEDITPNEVSLMEPGAVFYWSIGFFDYPGRGRSRESRIRFRRLMGPSKADIARAEKIGKKFAEFFK
ncbi:MAG: hypothetical protein JRK53_20915 [Deltaproteobacteria bacterium]|nr:hypothetical protein [Deltaproteobacteria bacterium]